MQPVGPGNTRISTDFRSRMSADTGLAQVTLYLILPTPTNGHLRRWPADLLDSSNSHSLTPSTHIISSIQASKSTLPHNRCCSKCAQLPPPARFEGVLCIGIVSHVCLLYPSHSRSSISISHPAILGWSSLRGEHSCTNRPQITSLHSAAFQCAYPHFWEWGVGEEEQSRQRSNQFRGVMSPAMELGLGLGLCISPGAGVKRSGLQGSVTTRLGATGRQGVQLLQSRRRSCGTSTKLRLSPKASLRVTHSFVHSFTPSLAHCGFSFTRLFRILYMCVA